MRDAGGGRVRIFFDGTEVARNTGGNTDERRIDFTVPDVEPGDYSVAAVGATFSADCGDFRVGGGPQVLGNSVVAGENGAGPSGSGAGESSLHALAFTGFRALVLLAVASALILAGLKLAAAGKRRRIAHR